MAVRSRGATRATGARVELRALVRVAFCGIVIPYYYFCGLGLLNCAAAAASYCC